MSAEFDPYYKWLAIPPRDQPPNHYRLLGVETFESDTDVIANAADQRMAHLRVFKTGDHVADAQRLLNEIASARTCLLNPDRKHDYDEGLRDELRAIEGDAVVEAVFDHVEPAKRAKPAAKKVPAFPGVEVGDTDHAFSGIEVGANEARASAAKPTTTTKPGRSKQPGVEAPKEKKPHPKAAQIRIIGHIVAPVLGLLLGAIILWYVRDSKPELAPGVTTAIKDDNVRTPRKPPVNPRPQPPKTGETNPGTTNGNNTKPANTDGGNDIPLPGTFVDPASTNPPVTDPFNVGNPPDPPKETPPVVVPPKEKTPEEKRQELQSRLAAAVEQFDVNGALDRSAELAELNGTDAMKAKIETLETCRTAAGESPEKCKAVAEAGLVLLDELIALKDQEAAQTLALATLASARSSKDNGLFGKAVLAFQKVKSIGSDGGS
jgi:hypothetical protein